MTRSDRLARRARLVRRAGALVAAIAVVVAGTGCGDTSDTRTGPEGSVAMRVASFNFAESRLLAELYAQVIAASGIPVVRLGPVGPREIIAPALELDLIDFVPEYLGTALEHAGAAEPEPDVDTARSELNRRLGPRDLVALTPSPAQDKNVVVVTAETAEREALVTISDLSGLAELRFGGPAECPDRPLCLSGLRDVYGLEFADFVPQRSLAFTAEALHRREIDVGLMFSTAAQLEGDALVVLEDDRGLQPAENVVPVVRVAALTRWGDELTDAVDALSETLTTADLRRLNRQVDAGAPIEDVVVTWLAQNLLIGTS